MANQLKDRLKYVWATVEEVVPTPASFWETDITKMFEREKAQQPSHLHQYKYLWSRCTRMETILKAWKKLRKGKTKRPEVIFIEDDFYFYAHLMQEMLLNTRPGGDPELAYHPTKLEPKIIFEHGKFRTIYCPPIWDQWVHHIVLVVLGPIIEKHSYKYSCGSMPGRGGLYGKKYLERVIKKRHFRYFAKLDIRHFFDNTRLEIVIRELNYLINDDWFIYLIKVIFMWFPKGLPLGFYISQWLANYVLCRMDWLVKRYNNVCYIRYVDDMVIGDDNKKKLHRTIRRIARILGKMKLRLKTNYQVCKFKYKRKYYISKKSQKYSGRSIDFMGYLFSHQNVTLRRRVLLRGTRMAKRISKLIFIAVRQAQGMLSRLGWYKHTDTKHTYKERIQPYVSIKSLKNIVSIDSKRRNANENRVDSRADYCRAA